MSTNPYDYDEYDHSRAKEDARNAWQDEQPHTAEHCWCDQYLYDPAGHARDNAEEGPPDMSKWKTLPEISLRLDEVRAKLTEAEDKLDALEASGRTVVYRTDPGTPCADCGGGYREDPADPESYIPHLTTLCPAIS